MHPQKLNYWRKELPDIEYHNVSLSGSSAWTMATKLPTFSLSETTIDWDSIGWIIGGFGLFSGTGTTSIITLELELRDGFPPSDAVT